MQFQVPIQIKQPEKKISYRDKILLTGTTEIKSFVEIISTQLNLPVSDWKFAHRQAILKCAERSLTADYQLNPRIELTDEVIRAKVAEIRKAEAEKAKPKPI